MNGELFRHGGLARRALHAASAWVRRVLIANLPFTFILAAALVAPDFIMDAAGGERRAVYTLDIVLYFLLFAFCASFAAPRRLIAGFLVLLGAFEVVHFCYLAYFGGVVDANLILQGIIEYEDVGAAGLGVARFLYHAPLVVIVPYAAAWLLMRPLLDARAVIPGLAVALLLAGAVVPYRIMRDGNAVHFYPVETLPSVANSYLTAATFFFNHVPKYIVHDGNAASADYQPAAVIRNSSPRKATVVIVMNESLTSDHMSLFGYARDTTPRLAALKTDPGFIYKTGISAGVGTNSTFHSFWNEVRDPRDEAAFVNQRTNLFRLAREAGFRTIFLSAQRATLLRGDGMQYVDVLRTLESEESLYERFHDEMFAPMLASIPLGERNLIVLHLRSAHGPFAANYRLRPELAVFPTRGTEYRHFQLNAYDNAVRYNDLVMSGLIEYFRRRIDGPLYVFLTSDHGQLLGEDGSHIGHGMLLPQVARVPIMLYEKGGDPAIASALANMKDPTHYELTVLIDRILGFEVRDPNAPDNVFYINGAGYNGLSGYMSVRKSRDPSQPTRYSIHPAG